LTEADPTQTGGQEEEEKFAPTTRENMRSQMEDAIAAKVHEAEKPDTEQLDVDENGDLQYARDEKGRFAPKDEPVAHELQPEADKAPATPVADTPAQPAVVAPKMVSIVVDGMTVEIEESRLIEAGKRTLQKESAADKRLQEAAQLKKQWEEETRRLQARASGEQEQPAPSQDAPQPAISPETLDVLLENKLYNLDAKKAAAKFKQDFPEIAADPHLMEMAASLENKRLATVTALGESYGDPFDAYHKHGEAIQQWMGKFKPAAVATEEKIERKRTIVAVPSASAKAPAPVEEKEPTVQQVIAQEQAARKAGRKLPYQRSR